MRASQAGCCMPIEIAEGRFTIKRLRLVRWLARRPLWTEGWGWATVG